MFEFKVVEFQHKHRRGHTFNGTVGLSVGNIGPHLIEVLYNQPATSRTFKGTWITANTKTIRSKASAADVIRLLTNRPII